MVKVDNIVEAIQEFYDRSFYLGIEIDRGYHSGVRVSVGNDCEFPTFEYDFEKTKHAMIFVKNFLKMYDLFFQKFKLDFICNFPDKDYEHLDRKIGSNTFTNERLDSDFYLKIWKPALEELLINEDIFNEMFDVYSNINISYSKRLTLAECFNEKENDRVGEIIKAKQLSGNKNG